MKAIDDAINYAEARISNAREALNVGALAPAKVNLDNAAIVLRAAELMHDVKGQRRARVADLRRTIKSLR